MAKIIIPANLKKFTENKTELILTGENLHDLLKNLKVEYPDLFAKIFSEDFSLKPFVALFRGDIQVTTLTGVDQKKVILDSDEVLFVMLAFSGG